MQLQLVLVGKTSIDWVQQAVVDYEKRIKRQVNFSMLIIPEVKQAAKMPEEVRKKKEGEKILQVVGESYLVLLDEGGKMLSSVDFASKLNTWFNASYRSVCFVVGGPYGFSDEVYRRANEQMSLSRMTFSHQLVRAIFMEQLYRGLSILNGDPYHHE